MKTLFRGWIGAVGCGICACVHPASPTEVATRYAQALEEGRLADAQQWTQEPADPSFQTRWADAALRQARAQEIRASLKDLQVQGPQLTLTLGPEGWRVLEHPPGPAAEAALSHFLEAAEAHDWDAVWRDLAADLRARYTPARLAADHALIPSVGERLKRARLAQARPPRYEGNVALFPVGPGKAVRLVQEGEGYKVSALE